MGELEKQLADLQASNAKLQVERDAIVKENSVLCEMVKDDTGKVIKGSVSLVLKETSGAERKMTVGFKSGRVKTHVIDIEHGWNEAVDSEALLAAANGKATDEQKAENPVLAKMTSTEAKAYIEHLVKIGYEGLEITA
jgi:hypothetical protein